MYSVTDYLWTSLYLGIDDPAPSARYIFLNAIFHVAMLQSRLLASRAKEANASALTFARGWIRLVVGQFDYGSPRD
jgi:hypothetical protein